MPGNAGGAKGPRQGRATCEPTTSAWPGRALKYRRHEVLDADADFGRRAFLHDHGAGHSDADQHAWRHLGEAKPDGYTLCQSDPCECRVDGRQELRTVAIILVGDSSRYAEDGSLQRGDPSISRISAAAPTLMCGILVSSK